MHYIGTHTDCEQYDKEVAESEGYGPVTKRWAEPRKHPTKDLWAIVAHDDYKNEASSKKYINAVERATKVDKLPDDWFPSGDLV